MIIIKTRTGDIFVNETETISVTHHRDANTAEINDGRGIGVLAKRNNTIRGVESVNYINDQTGNEWKDNGSMVEYLREIADKYRKDIGFLGAQMNRYKDFLRSFASDMIQIVCHNNGEIEDGTAKRIRDEAEMMNERANEFVGSLREAYDGEHKDEEDSAMDIVFKQEKQLDEYYTQIKELEAENKALSGRIDDLRTDHLKEVHRIYMRSLWERIINKRV